MNIPRDIMRECVLAAHAIGATPDIVQGGGGNISIKIDDELMLVKASGCRMKDMDETRGLVGMLHKQLRDYMAYMPRTLTEDAERRGFDMVRQSTRTFNRGVERASMEAGFHVLLPRCVLHTHSVYVNIITCMEEGERITNEFSRMLGRPILWIPHTPPGFSLALRIQDALPEFIACHGHPPQIIFLQNHGVIVAGEEMASCLALQERMNAIIRDRFRISSSYPQVSVAPSNSLFLSATPYLKHLLATRPVFFEQFREQMLFPDQAVYAADSSASQFDIDPKNDCIIHYGALKEAQTIEETLTAYVYIREQIERAGHTVHPLPKEDVAYILSMESETYRKNTLRSEV